MSRETLLDEVIAKAKECGDWQLVEWLRMARGGESAARWYTGKFADMQAENDKMVMKLNAEHIVRQNVERENDKLRELVADMWFWCYEGHMDSESQEWQMKHIDGVLDRMRELGVEFGDG